MFIALNYLVWNYQFSDTIQRHSQNLKQVPQNCMKTFNVDEVTLISQLMTLYRKINIASEKIINYKVTFPSNHHCFQINVIVQARPGISVAIYFFVFLRRYGKIFELLKPVYSYVFILTSLYQLDKKLSKPFPAK